MATTPATSTAADVTFQGITLTVVSSSAQAGAQITINLGARDGKNVAWSTGQDFDTSSGIQLRSRGGAVPVSSFAITSEKITFMLAPSDSGGGQTQFQLAAFLAADPTITEFTLSLTSDQNTQVQAELSMEEPKALGPSPTVFDWPGASQS